MLKNRRILMQIILLLLYSRHQPPGDNKKDRKRKRRHREEATTPAEDPKMALELLVDRVSVWLAVAELGIVHAVEGSTGTGKGKEEEGVLGMMKRFWDEVVVVLYASQIASTVA